MDGRVLACGPTKAVTECGAAMSSGMARQYLRHTEPHATKANATGVPGKRSAGVMHIRSQNCEACGITVGGASESGADGASFAPSAARARAGAGAASGGCGAGGAWDAAQVPQMRAANVGVRPARCHTPATMHHTGINRATTHGAGDMPSTVSEHRSDTRTLVRSHVPCLSCSAGIHGRSWRALGVIISVSYQPMCGRPVSRRGGTMDCRAGAGRRGARCACRRLRSALRTCALRRRAS